MQCPTEHELNLCLLGKVNDARADALIEHAESCETCAKVVSSLENSTATNNDRVTETLRQQSDFDVTDECERMIDRVEIYVQGDIVEDLPETKKHLLQGTRIRDYEIVRPIGEGGMGAVFLARHKRLNSEVALKVLSLRRSNDREAQQRFEQEMAIVGKLQHPGIVRALDAGEHEGVQYLVMELVQGMDLRQIVDAVGPIPVADACEVCRQAAVALDYAHSERLIHRDVKPSNLMLSRSNTVKVMDLGLARFTDQHRSLTSTQQAIGSLDFMSPEQLRAENVDHRADVYSLGCTLHYLLMGEPPEKRRTASLMVSRTPKMEALRSVLPPPLTRLLQRMLAADPAKRADSLAEIAKELAPFCSRADLAVLANNASKLAVDSAESKGSITSKVSKPDVPNAWRTWPWLLAGLATLMCTILASGWWGRDGGSVLQPRNVDALPCVSSNMEPTREIPLFQVHDDAVRCGVYCEATSQLICGSDDASITIRDLPNQQRIIRICEFNAPIVQLAVDDHSQRVACLDSNGAIAVVALPDGETVWTLSNERASKARKIAFTDSHRLVVQFQNDSVRQYDLEGQPISPTIANPSDEAARLFEESVYTPPPFARLLRTKNKEFAKEDIRQIGNGLIVVDQHLLRLFDSNNLDDDHFVYAEHANANPICFVLAISDDTLLLTADESGEIRLWHAPGRSRSDMLLSCASKLESDEVTFQIHRQQRWTRKDFSSSPSDVKMDDADGEMRIETQMQRNGRQHVLEYRISGQQAGGQQAGGRQAGGRQASGQQAGGERSRNVTNDRE